MKAMVNSLLNMETPWKFTTSIISSMQVIVCLHQCSSNNLIMPQSRSISSNRNSNIFHTSSSYSSIGTNLQNICTACHHHHHNNNNPLIIQFKAQQCSNSPKVSIMTHNQPSTSSIHQHQITTPTQETTLVALASLLRLFLERLALTLKLVPIIEKQKRWKASKTTASNHR